VGADEQVDFAAENLPQHEDLTYYMIGGNHDYSHYKSGGVDVVRKLSELRSDVVALGFDQQDVQFGNWTIRLIHPSGGAPYARSYRAQKLAEGAMIGELWESVRESADEAIATSSVPMLLVWGHLHYVDITPYGPIFTLGPGCFEGQTNYLVTKGLIPSIGGFVVDVPEELDPVCRLKYEHFQYQEIPDDYLSYASTIKTRRILKVK
jgi:predicted phosphodiesterase